VTPETFAIWLKQRADKKAAEADAAQKAKATQRAAGRVNGMSGRHMFEFGGVQDEEVGFGFRRRYVKLMESSRLMVLLRLRILITIGGRG
jgi:hypothetical protein